MAVAASQPARSPGPCGAQLHAGMGTADGRVPAPVPPHDAVSAAHPRQDRVGFRRPSPMAARGGALRQRKNPRRSSLEWASEPRHRGDAPGGKAVGRGRLWPPHLCKGHGRARPRGRTARPQPLRGSDWRLRPGRGQSPTRGGRAVARILLREGKRRGDLLTALRYRRGAVPLGSLRAGGGGSEAGWSARDRRRRRWPARTGR